MFPVYAPLEVIHAAGLLPVGLFGAGNKVFAPTDAGFDIRFSLEDIYARGDIALPALPGIALGTIPLAIIARMTRSSSLTNSRG